MGPGAGCERERSPAAGPVTRAVKFPRDVAFSRGVEIELNLGDDILRRWRRRVLRDGSSC